MTARTFKGAVDSYVRERGSDLAGQDVTVVALKHVAAALDVEVNASLIAQYRMLYATLEAARNSKVQVSEFDEDDDLLSPSR